MVSLVGESGPRGMVPARTAHNRVTTFLYYVYDDMLLSAAAAAAGYIM